MNSLQRYTATLEPTLQSIEKGQAFDIENLTKNANALITNSTDSDIKLMELTMRRIVSARKELAIQHNGLKPLFAAMKRKRRS